MAPQVNAGRSIRRLCVWPVAHYDLEDIAQDTVPSLGLGFSGILLARQLESGVGGRTQEYEKNLPIYAVLAQ